LFHKDLSKASELLKRAALNRDLARRAKKLADISPDGAERARLTRYVAELEAQGLKLERDAAEASKAPLF
jgi:hypothetical protein